MHIRPSLLCSSVTVMLSIISRWMAKKNHKRGQNTSKGTYKRDLHSKPKWETDTQDLSTQDLSTQDLFVLLPRWFCRHFLEVRQTNGMHIKRGLRNKRHAHQKRPQYITCLCMSRHMKCIPATCNTYQRHQIHPAYIKDILHTWNRSQRHQRHSTYRE